MKKRLFGLVGGGLLLVSLSVSAQNSRQNPKDVAAIKQLVTHYKSSINAADTVLGAKIFAITPEVTFIHPRGHEKGWSGVKKGIYGMFRDRFSRRDLKSSNEQIFVYGNTAVVEFYWVFDAVFTGEKPTPLQTKGRETQVLRKSGNDWRIVHVHYSGMPVTGERQGF